MSLRKNLYSLHRLFITLMFAALICGGAFFVTNNFDFLIDTITYGKASFPNMMYWLSKVVGTILIPIVFLVPSTPSFTRIKIVKFTFILYGVLHILTQSWIIWYIAANGFNGLFSDLTISQFQLTNENSFVSPLVYWCTCSWTGNITSLLFGAFCIYTGTCFDDNKRKVCTLVSILTAIRLILPIVYDLIFPGQTFVFWVTNNYADIVCFLLLTASLYIASTYDATWIALIWDQEVPERDEDA